MHTPLACHIFCIVLHTRHRYLLLFFTSCSVHRHIQTHKYSDWVEQVGWIPVQMVLLSHPHALPDTADEHRGTRTCRHTQRHQQDPSPGSQIGVNPPSLTSFLDRHITSPLSLVPTPVLCRHTCSHLSLSPSPSHICPLQLDGANLPAGQLLQLSRHCCEHHFGGKDSATVNP